MWLRTRKGRKKLSVRFLAKLKQSYPEYYAKAVKMNKRDNFVMWDKRERYRKNFAKKPAKATSKARASATGATGGADVSKEESKGENDDGKRQQQEEVKAKESNVFYSSTGNTVQNYFCYKV